MAKNQEKASAMDGIKKSIGKATDLAALKLKLGQTKAKRKEAYARLGELAYTTYRPRTVTVTEDIENAIAAVVNEITQLTHAIVELELRIKILKADM